MKNNMIINSRDMQYFIACHEQGSFRKAGLWLGTQESSVSRRIRVLEDQLGATLFHRYGGGVGLTLAGERFLLRARKILQDIMEATAEASSFRRRADGLISIGLSCSWTSGFLIDLLAEYRHHHAKVDIRLVEGNPADHVAALRNSQIDIALLAFPLDPMGFQTASLWSDNLLLALPVDHDLAAKEEIGWEDVAGEVFLTTDWANGHQVSAHLSRSLEKLGQHPELCFQSVSSDGLLPLVAMKWGVALRIDANPIRYPGVIYRQLSGERIPYGAVWLSKNSNPALEPFLRIARRKSRLIGS